MLERHLSMARRDIDEILSRIEHLAADINTNVPNIPKNIQFRADLAGLLVVAVVASYETCVKETLMNYAHRYHIKFGKFTQNQFKKLNSRISISDLNGYANNFDESVYDRFRNKITKRKDQINNRVGRDLTTSYTQMLRWRHDFAHSGTRNTTVEEALLTHKFAKRVLYIFDDAFSLNI